MPFNTKINLIANGEPVNASVTNRAIEQLNQNVNYLLSLLNQASIGSAIFATRVSVAPGIPVGSPVYYNATTSRFEKALASATIEEADGFVAVNDASQVVGIVHVKHSDTLADLLLSGWAEVDLSEVTDETANGPYYLSAQTAGTLLQQRPPVSVHVLMRAGSFVYVNPQVADFIDRHVHYKFDLACTPAGTHTAPALDERHVITDADEELPGWLPADHESFGGLAPAGASFGYNLAADEALANAWPPLPLESAYLEWSKGTNKDVGFTGVPVGEQGLVIMDRNGIWWMSDCYDDVPWPTDYESSDSLSVSESINECPRELQMAIRLYFNRVSFATEQSVVSSLRSLDPRLIVRCADSESGSRGDLVIDLELDQAVVSQGVAGHLVLKDMLNGEFTRGPVIEGLYAVSENVILDSAYTQEIGGKTVHQGLVGITVLPQDTRILDVAEVRLDGVGQEFYQDIMYLGFPAGQENSYRGRIDVPADLAVESPVLRIRLRILGRAAGTLPTLTITGRRVGRPESGLATPLDLPLSGDEFSIAIATEAILASANQYVEALSDEFEVAAGDQVFFTVTRADDDAYVGELGILHHESVLTSSS
jgi:hypothetical protein